MSDYITADAASAKQGKPVISSTETAIRILRRWQDDVSKLRVMFGSTHTLVTCHCKVHSLDDAFWIWCIGSESGDEVRFDLTGAMAIALINCEDNSDDDGALAGFVDQALCITWADGTRLNVVKEKLLASQWMAS